MYYEIFFLLFALFNINSAQALKLPLDSSREEIRSYIQAKQEKYRELATYSMLSEDSRDRFKEAASEMDTSLVRTRISRISDEKLKDILKERFAETNDFLLPAKTEWKEKVGLILEKSTDRTSFKGDTLIAGCGHIQSQDHSDDSDHRHEGIYTLNDKPCEDGSAPDLEVDIRNTYIIKKAFPHGQQFQTIYLENITTSPLESQKTFKSVLHLLKPGGQLIFDRYYSCNFGYVRPSEIDRCSASINMSEISPLRVRYDILPEHEKVYREAFAGVGVTLKVYGPYSQYLVFNEENLTEKNKLVEICSTMLMTKYLESMGFVGVALKKVEENPYNERKNSIWFCAQKPGAIDSSGVAARSID
ncbi:MAG: hypothetical protein K2Y08_04195 [Alphaproteobacteria bacterium]|nr:hypothetical protein [Alphaproteobacteria bacterium]